METSNAVYERIVRRLGVNPVFRYEDWAHMPLDMRNRIQTAVDSGQSAQMINGIWAEYAFREPTVSTFRVGHPRVVSPELSYRLTRDWRYMPPEIRIYLNNLPREISAEAFRHYYGTSNSLVRIPPEGPAYLDTAAVSSSIPSLQSLTRYQIFINGHPLMPDTPALKRIWGYLLESQRTRLLDMPRILGVDHAYKIVFTDITSTQRDYLARTMRDAGVEGDVLVLEEQWRALLYPSTGPSPILRHERSILPIPPAQHRRISAIAPAALYIPNEMGDFLGIPQTRPPSPEPPL